MILILYRQEQIQSRFGRALSSDQNIYNVNANQVEFLCNIFFFSFMNTLFLEQVFVQCFGIPLLLKSIT